jgi:hypothetical protein
MGASAFICMTSGMQTLPTLLRHGWQLVFSDMPSAYFQFNEAADGTKGIQDTLSALLARRRGSAD